MIDKQGKLFGKINIIDFVVVLLIVAVVGVVGIKMFGGSSSEDTASAVQRGTATVTIRLSSVAPESKDYLQVGDKLIIAGQVTTLEITEVRFEEVPTTGFTDEGELVVAGNPVALNAYVTVQSEGTRNELGVTTAGVVFRANQIFEFVTDNFEALTNSRVVSVEFEEN